MMKNRIRRPLSRYHSSVSDRDSQSEENDDLTRKVIIGSKDIENTLRTPKHM